LANSSVHLYEELSSAELISILQTLEVKMHDFLDYTLEYKGKVNYTICVLDLIDAIKRVHKRKYYFKVFHKDMVINEGKEAALFAYWIAKLRPIKITDEYMDTPGYNDTVNEMFAIHYLIAALCGIKRIHLKDKDGGIELALDNPFLVELQYSLRYRSLPIDSMIVLADSITTDSFIDFSPTHKVKLHGNPDDHPDGLIIMNEPQWGIEPLAYIPDETEIQYISVGGMTEFNSISAPWFEIKTKSGIQGWCFSGDLEKI